MLLMMLEKGMRIDRIINVDTTKEFPQMYEHLEKLQKYVGIPFEIMKIDFDYWFGEHVKTKGKNKGQVGYGWCDFSTRWCTGTKQNALSFLVAKEKYNPRKHSTCKVSVEKIDYIGIAVDEPKRIKVADNLKYPLVDWGMTEKEALQYCYDSGFDWDGLYEEGRSRVSCYCCPLQRINELRLTYKNHKELWNSIVEMDKKTSRRFTNRRTLESLQKKFEYEQSLGRYYNM